MEIPALAGKYVETLAQVDFSPSHQSPVPCYKAGGLLKNPAGCYPNLRQDWCLCGKKAASIKQLGDY
ncbi:hypothetical protein FACHB389_31055 [Nostoc calcicola FACHB-389]|nr:hypothetical protein FACHB389_31055 [Nostoc calcicola FACHB-389]